MSGAALGFYGVCLIKFMNYYQFATFQAIRDELINEIQERLIRQNQDCMNALLVGSLRYYKFNDSEISELTAKALSRLKIEHEDLLKRRKEALEKEEEEETKKQETTINKEKTSEKTSE